MFKFWQIRGFAGDHKMTTLSVIAGNIVSKGILAMDESQSTISKRLEAVKLEPNPKNIEAWKGNHCNHLPIGGLYQRSYSCGADTWPDS